MGDLRLIPALLLVLFAIVVIAGALYQRAGARDDARRFPPPGRMIDVGDGRLHIRIAGEGSPAVVFEAGIAATSLSWELVQPEIAKFTQSVSYDRAWLGWSDRIPQPRGVEQLIHELRTVLDRADVVKPRILVAHSFGGLIAVAYAASYPSEVAGIVLVDPVGASEWASPSKQNQEMMRRAILLSRVGDLLARFGIVRFTLNRLSAGTHTLPKLIARASSGRRGSAFTERMVGEIRKLPARVWPQIQAHWCDPKCFQGIACYLQALQESAAAVMREVTQIQVPLIVLSAGNANPAQRADHERLAMCSTQGRIEIVPGTGHWIQLDRPDLVISAICEMLPH
jgi:pimeloyl-ACP methyl ester carboxylesterase